MATFAVAGLYALETHLNISGFPLNYTPVCYPNHGIMQSHAGAGYVLSVALTRLGNTVRFASFVGSDEVALNARHALAAENISDFGVIPLPGGSAQKIVLTAPDGAQQTHWDLKEIGKAIYPEGLWPDIIGEVDAVIVGKPNFARAVLEYAHGQLVATDLDALNHFSAPYEQDFLARSDIVFISNKALPMSPEASIQALYTRYQTSIIVITLGAEGLVFSEQGGVPIILPSRLQRPVVSALGAGDALFAAFMDQYLRSGDLRRSLINAQAYAGWKIGEQGATNGLLDQAQFATLLEHDVFDIDASKHAPGKS